MGSVKWKKKESKESVAFWIGIKRRDQIKWRRQQNSYKERTIVRIEKSVARNNDALQCS